MTAPAGAGFKEGAAAYKRGDLVMDSLTGVASGDVRSTPESGRWEGGRCMSAFDP